MLRWVILVVAVVLLTAAATLVTQFLPDAEEASKVAVVEVTGPQPKVVVVGDPVYDFGKMTQHDQSTHTWTIKNEGVAPLELWLDGKPTCSCTIAKLENGAKATIEPGESTTIELGWQTKDFHDDYSQGATFGTNDPRTKTFKLAIKGLVFPPVAVFPHGIEFARGLPNDKPHQLKCFIYSKERPDLKITKISSSRPGLIVGSYKPMKPEEIKQLKAEKGYEVTVELRPGMPLGVFQDELVIATDHPKQPEIRLPVGGKMDGPISITPPGLWLHDVVSRDGATKDLRLLVRGGKETEFRVVDKPEKLDVSVEPAGDGGAARGHYNLKIKIPPGTAAGKVIGNIVLKTNHPMAGELKIPVDVLISRSGPG